MGPMSMLASFKSTTGARLLSDVTMKYSEGLAKARALIELAGPAVEHIEIVGSLRRQRTFVGDIELLIKPKMGSDPSSLFGDEESKQYPLTDQLFDELVERGLLKKRLKSDDTEMWGSRAKLAIFEDAPVDLFICMPPAHFGVLQLIRTGPKDFSRQAVTQISKGGWLPDNLRCEDGQIIRDDGHVLNIPTERDFFDVLGMDFIEPAKRDQKMGRRF
jgi:DNA polymerase/3'-5' exonuclease PolX